MSRRTRRQKPQDATAGIAGIPAVPWHESRALALAVLLFGSGIAALVYETLWVRQLGRVVGTEVRAVSLALSAFFAGLAIGSVSIGRLADRVVRPIKLYAWLEASVAVAGIASTLALARSASLFVRLHDATGLFAWVLPFALVSVPAILMGGTLPVVVRSLYPTPTRIAPATGLLYSANTAGAIVGTLATPFVLVPVFGIEGAGFFAGALGLALAAAALVMDSRNADTDVVRPLAPERQVRFSRGDARLALALYALAGAIALGYEVVWSELLVQFMSTRTYAFAVMLATYLTGLALGSVLFARFGASHQQPWRLFGFLLAGAAASALALVALLGTWLPDMQTFAGMWAMRATGRETFEVMARFVVAAAVVLLVPTTLLGAAFPAATRLIASADRVAGDIGRTLALNTTGGVIGTLVTGFVLVPWLGLVGSLAVLAVAGGLIGGIALLRGGLGRVATAAIMAAILALTLTPRDKLATLLAEKRGGTLLFYAEDTGGTVAVLEQGAGSNAFRRLYIQGVSNSGNALPSLRYMRLQALLPLIVHPGTPRSALVVGFGTGITAGALLAVPSLDKRVVAELLPSVVHAGALFTGNLGAASDPRLDVRIGDGRHELLRSSERYDLITLEPPPPSAAGVVNLYSRDFYALCHERLAPGGLMAQWWPLATQNDEDSRSLVRSFLDVFPHTTLWTTELHEMLLVGSDAPLVVDSQMVARRFGVAETARALADVGIESPAALLATFVMNRDGLERYAGAASPVTDDRPRIDHARWVRRGEFQRVLPQLLDHATDVPIDARDPVRTDVEAERRELFTFYRAALHAYAGEGEAAAAALQDVRARDPGNPYYQWVAMPKP